VAEKKLKFTIKAGKSEVEAFGFEGESCRSATGPYLKGSQIESDTPKVEEVVVTESESARG
jgi:hypothetical protein